MTHKGTLLITGGAGYIGSHAAVEFLQLGYQVIIADSLFNAEEQVLNRIAHLAGKEPLFERADLSIEAECKRVFDRHADIEAVINFAAHKSIQESIQQPIKYYKNNLGVITQLLHEMQQRKIRCFIQSSSCTVYGEPVHLPVCETARFRQATTPYANTKQMAEEMLFFAAKHGEIQTIALRYFNPIGAHHSTLLGELPLGVPQNLMPIITQTAIGKYDRLTVFGNDYNTPDGTCIRDYVHVVDLAKAHVLAVERCLNNRIEQPFEVFNIGSGIGISVMQMIASFERVSGVKLNYEIASRRVGDIAEIWADTSRAYQKLAWKPMHSLDEMTHSAWQWQKALPRQQHNRFFL